MVAAEVPSSTTFNWKIENFSKLNAKDGFGSSMSDVFSFAGFNWEARIYPKGWAKGTDHVSLFLRPVFSTKPVDVEFSFTVTSQTDPSMSMTRGMKCQFQKGGSNASLGWDTFMPLCKLHDPKNGYIVNDTCVITIELTCPPKKESKGGDGMNEGKPNKVTKTQKEKETKEKDGKSSSKSGDQPAGVKLSEFRCCFPFYCYMKFSDQ